LSLLSDGVAGISSAEPPPRPIELALALCITAPSNALPSEPVFATVASPGVQVSKSYLSSGSFGSA
jgi:hypothetical protein